MASQQFIHQREETVCDAKASVAELLEAAKIETEQGGNRANYDSWGTLLVNLTVLQSLVNKAIPEIEAVKAAAKGGK